ncbi:MAG: ectonucleotide pyrophosphatase/phosphodiesterase [Bacteroidales bacterium]|nr:ectonucleotide pyrophosphatase/phosphodiesterase [Bacteroidales bacterium]
MKKISFGISVFFISLSLFFTSCSEEKKADQPYLVVLSMDGFRWDYPDKAETPNLDRLLKQGVKAERMISSFPTKTFPNHYTMATGLYPDHHGIVLNSFYDPVEDRYYSTHDRNLVGDGSFYGGEPIWNTAEKQGLKAATLFWVGSEADVQGMRPSIWKKYEHSMPYANRIDTVISWLQKPAGFRPHLIMWYYDQPDGDGHDFGPDSPEIQYTVQYLDSLLGVFIDKLSALPIADKINFIVTSDHGMCDLSDDRVVMLDDFIDTAWLAEVQGNNPVWTIQAKDGFDDEIAEGLAKAGHIKWWPSSEIPKRLNYGSNPRTLDFVVVADSSWSLFYIEKGSYLGGTHGFDNANTDMHAIFYASGPAFKSDGFVNPVFRNVSLYPLMCKILNLNPAPNDGNLEEVREMLK